MDYKIVAIDITILEIGQIIPVYFPTYESGQEENKESLDNDLCQTILRT